MKDQASICYLLKILKRSWKKKKSWLINQIKKSTKHLTKHLCKYKPSEKIQD